MPIMKVLGVPLHQLSSRCAAWRYLLVPAAHDQHLRGYGHHVLDREGAGSGVDDEDM